MIEFESGMKSLSDFLFANRVFHYKVHIWKRKVGLCARGEMKRGVLHDRFICECRLFFFYLKIEVNLETIKKELDASNSLRLSPQTTAAILY